MHFMRGREVVLAVFVLTCACEQGPPQVPQLPPEPGEEVALRNPVEEIGRALLEGGLEEKREALSRILSLDEVTQKEQRATLHGLLRRCLSDEDPALRKEAALVFVEIEGGLDGLVRSLDLVPEEDEDVLGVALQTIEETLKSEEPRQRLRVVDMLSEIGRPAMGLLLKTLEDRSAEVRLGALDALWSIGPGGPGFAQRISALLKDPDPRVRQAAAAAVERLREEQEPKPLPVERRAPVRPGRD